MRKILNSAAILAVIGLSPAIAQADSLKIATTIAPIHSLISQVISEKDQVSLLIPVNQSPHHYVLRPSDVKKIQEADLVFRVSPRIESQISDILKKFTTDSTLITLSDHLKKDLLPKRSGINWPHHHDHGDEDDHGKEHAHKDEHDHDHGKEHAHKDEHDHDHGKEHAHKDEHDHDHGKEHAHKDEHDHDHGKEHAHKDEHDHDHGKEHAHKDKHDHDHGKEHAHKDEHDHDHGKEHAHKDEHDHDHEEEHGKREDHHIWMSSKNAQSMIDVIVAGLSDKNPEQAATYRQNGDKAKKGLQALHSEVQKTLSKSPQKTFAVMHDSFQYFETEYGLKNAGALVLSPEQGASAKHLRALNKHLLDQNTGCVFGEPQLNVKLAKSIAGDLSLHFDIVDPLGVDIQAGPDLYATLMRKNADVFAACFAAP